MRRGWWLPFLVLLECTGCGSTPTQYFVLQTQEARLPTSPAPGVSLPIALRHVIIPTELDRRSYIFYGNGSTLSIDQSEQWGAPMDRMIQSVIAADLASDLPERHVLAPGDPLPQGPHETLAITIRHFGADAGGRARLSADWTLIGPLGATKAEDSVTLIRQGSSSDAQSTVPLMNDALADFAKRIAAELSKSGGTPSKL